MCFLVSLARAEHFADPRQLRLQSQQSCTLSDTAAEPRAEPAFDGATVSWKSYTGLNGSPYRVGTKETEDKIQEESGEGGRQTQSKERFGLYVNWPVGDKNWKETSQEVKDKAGITRHRLSAVDGSFLTYRPDFTNTVNDDCHDSRRRLRKKHLRNDDYSVEYNSSKPTIIFIRGS